MEAESVFSRHPIRVFLLSGAILALASAVERPSMAFLAVEEHATPGVVSGPDVRGTVRERLSPRQGIDRNDRVLTWLSSGRSDGAAAEKTRGGLHASGRPVRTGAVVFAVAERIGSSSGQGGVAGGTGCVCDSDCSDGNVCTTDTCDLGTGLCEQAFAPGTPCRGDVDPDGLFCTLGVCDNAGLCIDNDLGGSPCDFAAEVCNDITDNCDGVECTLDSHCPLPGEPSADPAQCQVDTCVAGRCRFGTQCLAGDLCDGAGVCTTVLDGRCCMDVNACANTTLAACDNGGGAGSGPWAVGDGTCQCPFISFGHNDNVGAAFLFSISASENCTVEGATGAAPFNKIGDDYVTTSNAAVLLDALNFVGGVAGDGDLSATIEIWDGSVDPPVLVDARTLTFPSTGVFFWSAEYTGIGVVAPAVGWVTMRPADGGGETVTWFSANEIGAIGANNTNLMWVNNERRSLLQPNAPDILAFELVGDPVDPTGACCLGENNCNDTMLNVPWLCEAAGGTFIAGESCFNNPCSVATCCFGDGSCSVLDPATCTAQGGTVGAFGGTCGPNCCPQVFSAGDTCGTETVKLLDTLAAGIFNPVTARYSGDSSNATHGHCNISTAQTCNSFVPSGGPEPDSCPPGEFCNVDEVCLNGDFDAGHWEGFVITAASEVRIGYCCSDENDSGAAGIHWLLVVDDCVACTKVLWDSVALCADGNPGETYLLNAGVYHYAVFASRVCLGTQDACQTDADCDPGVPCFEQTGTYELEIEATMLPFVTCCFQDICIDELSPNPVTTLECDAQGGFELVGVPDCFGDPCTLGACCVGLGDCQDNAGNGVSLPDCELLGGSFVGGADCVVGAPCPICGLDNLENGGPDCQAANGNFILVSDRALDPPLIRADDFSALTGGVLTEICFEATYRVPGAVCCADTGSQMPDSWEITVYEDDGMIPAAPLAAPQILQNVISGAPTLCTQTKSGSGLVGITLNSGQCYWMEISGFGEGPVGNPPAPGCTTGLLSSLDGNNYMVVGTLGGYTLGDVVTDLFGDSEADFAFCVEGGMGPLCNRDAACCFDPDGPPPLCQILSPADCLAAGGSNMPGQVCEPDVCPGSCEAETCVDQVSLNQPGEPCEGGLPCARPYTNAFCGPKNNGSGCPGSLGADVWYSYTTGADECGPLTISTCDGNFDGQLAVYDGGPNCDCPADESIALACDDDFCGPGVMSQVTFAASADTCYIVRLGGWHASQGSADLSLSIVAEPGGCDSLVAEPVLADDAMNIDGGTVACASDAECPCISVCRNGFCYAPKGRFVSVSPNPANVGLVTARRVCVDAPGPGNHCRWVEAPVARVGPGPGPVPILVSNLVPGPLPEHFRDWSLDAPDSQGNFIVNISGCAVSNGHTYIIQTLILGADPNNESNYSGPLSLPTAGRFGDVDLTDSTSIGDVFHITRGWQATQVLPRTWLKIGPSGNAAADPTSITIPADALLAVKAFQGQTYLDQAGACAPAGCAPEFGDCNDCGGGCPPLNPCPASPGGCKVGGESPASIQLVPVKASGVEGADWVAGPGPNDITLMHGGQDVAVEVFIQNLGANNVALYQFGLDCNYAFSVSGGLDPYSAECPNAGLPFDSGACLGVDGDRPDWILAPAGATIAACQTTATCPDGLSGKFVCGAVLISGAPGSGPGPFYGATFGFAVSAGAEGAASVDLDLNETLLADVDSCVFLLQGVTPANIIIAPDIGRCCGDPGGALQCSDGVTLNQCLAVGGGFTAGGVCSGVEGPEPGLDSACVACTVDADCTDSDPCTDDECNVSGICTNIQDTQLCCNPETGAKMLIDDQNICTDDVCDPLTGLVSHVGSATDGVCAAAQGSRFIAATPPCGLSGTCDETSLVAMSLAIEVEPGVAITLGFIQPDGSLGVAEAFQTPSTWGTVLLSGGFIRPSTTYIVTLVPMPGLTGGSSSSTTTADFADVDGNGVVNFVDIQIVALVFVGDPRFIELFADLDPCLPNDVINVGDILATVRGFQNQTFGEVCPEGVCCLVPGGKSETCLWGPPEDCLPFFDEDCPFRWFESECPGDWTEGGVCGEFGECPAPPP